MPIISQLLESEQAGLGGRNNVARIAFNDPLLALAATAATLNLGTYLAGDVIDLVLLDPVTVFLGASITALTVAVGFLDNTVDTNTNTGAFIPATSLLTLATTQLAAAGTVCPTTAPATTYSSGNASNLALLALALMGQQIYACGSPGTLQATFAATGANLSVLTTGQFSVYWRQIRPSLFRNSNLV